MIYDNLAECYEKDGLNNVAMEAYRTAYQILEGESAQGISIKRNCRHILFAK